MRFRICIIFSAAILFTFYSFALGQPRFADLTPEDLQSIGPYYEKMIYKLGKPVYKDVNNSEIDVENFDCSSMLSLLDRETLFRITDFEVESGNMCEDRFFMPFIYSCDLLWKDYNGNYSLKAPMYFAILTKGDKYQALEKLVLFNTSSKVRLFSFHFDVGNEHKLYLVKIEENPFSFLDSLYNYDAWHRYPQFKDRETEQLDRTFKVAWLPDYMVNHNAQERVFFIPGDIIPELFFRITIVGSSFLYALQDISLANEFLFFEREDNYIDFVLDKKDLNDPERMLEFLEYMRQAGFESVPNTPDFKAVLVSVEFRLWYDRELSVFKKRGNRLYSQVQFIEEPNLGPKVVNGSGAVPHATRSKTKAPE